MAELGEMLSSLGKTIPSELELTSVMEEMDTDNDGAVDFKEFLTFMTK